MMNLLNAVAVDDILKIRKDAENYGYKTRVLIIWKVENFLKAFRLLCCNGEKEGCDGKLSFTLGNDESLDESFQKIDLNEWIYGFFQVNCNYLCMSFFINS